MRITCYSGLHWYTVCITHCTNISKYNNNNIIFFCLIQSNVHIKDCTLRMYSKSQFQNPHLLNRHSPVHKLKNVYLSIAISLSNASATNVGKFVSKHINHKICPFTSTDLNNHWLVIDDSSDFKKLLILKI